MALLDLYIQVGGNDLNAGTNNGSNPTAIGCAATTGCTYSAGTLTFTAGTTGAFTGTGVSVGAWVSLYNSADSVARVVGKVDTIDGTSTTITLLYASGTGYSSTGLGLITGLTAGGAANSVYCRVGGAWASFAITGTGGCMTGTVPSLSGAINTYNGLRINIKAGSYILSSAITLPAGLAAKPIWWRGYYATIGDIDNCANVNGTLVAPPGQTAAPTGATRPQISFSTAVGFTAGAFNWFDSLEVISSGTAMTGGTISRFTRCRFTSTGSAYYGLSANGATLVGCVVSNTASGTGWVGGGNAIGCVFRGPTSAGGVQGIGTVNIMFCVFETTGLILGSQPNMIVNNAFYNCASGISNPTSGNGTHLMVNNIFASNRAYGINQSAMTNPAQAYLINNDFYGNTSGTINNLFESLQVGAITTESATPFVSPGANHDYTLTSSALARQAGFPGQFEV